MLVLNDYISIENYLNQQTVYDIGGMAECYSRFLPYSSCSLLARVESISNRHTPRRIFVKYRIVKIPDRKNSGIVLNRSSDKVIIGDKHERIKQRAIPRQILSIPGIWVQQQ